MRIGDVAARTQVPPRLIRYYEQQGLLRSERTTNGYRSYAEADVARIQRVAGLVQAGLPTRLVKVLVETEDAEARDEQTCPIALAEQLAGELVGIESRIACLSLSRDTIRSYLVRTSHEALIRQAELDAAHADSRSDESS